MCGECNHVYVHARDLRKAHRRQVWRLYLKNVRLRSNNWDDISVIKFLTVLFRPARKIYFCQHCIHDF